MLQLLHKKGRRSDHLSTSTLLRKEEEDGPNSRTRHQLGERGARLARRFGGGLDLEQHSRSHSRRTVRGLRGQERHHGGRDFWSDRRAIDAAHSLLPRGLCCRAYGKPLWSQARAVGGPAGSSGNDRTGAHRSGSGRKFHRPAWRRHTARSGHLGCAERPAARVDHYPLGLWHPRPLIPVHRRGTWGRTWGQSRTRASLPTLKKGQIGVMDNLQVPDKELRCEACGRVIKPERDEKVERVTDEDGVVRVFCELNLCRQERLEVHIRAFNARIAPERAGLESPPKPMVRICESCGREIKVERGEQSHPVWQKNGVMRMFCTLPMCDLDARVVEEEEERAKAWLLENLSHTFRTLRRAG